MTKLGKIAKKFLNNPEAVTYRDIERLLLVSGFDKLNPKGSHIKFKHHTININIIVPVHNKECKDFYKKYILKLTEDLIKDIK